MTSALPFWRFLPDETVPDAACLQAAAEKGRGVFARTLREVRYRLGSQRAAALLRETERGDRIGRPFTLLVASAFQPRAMEDALRVAFAVAGLTAEMRMLDGFAAIETSDASVFRDVDMAFVPLLPAAGGTTPDIRALAEAFRQRCGAPMLFAAAGIGELPETTAGQQAEFVTVAMDGAVIDDRFGRTFGAMPTPDAADRLADAAAGFAAVLAGAAPKLVVTDLDGTLWNGVLGEDGPDKLDLHRSYAEALKAFAGRGIVLAIASRNDAQDVDTAFAGHPEWPISRDDFAAAAIGWNTKDALAEEILLKLNLGAEHMLFIDDDPVNCAAVAERFPQADVRLFGTDRDTAAVLLADPLLRRTGSGDTDRTEQYRRRDAVEHLRGEAPDLGEFLRRLRTRLTIVPLDESIAPRAAELASRVNQFALNDRRPGVAELVGRASPLDFMVRLDDAFGSHGLVGLVLARAEGEAVVLASFFLSCRAFGRGVENAMLFALGALAAARGCDRIVGAIDRLPRNEPARRCFSRYLDAEGEGAFTIHVDGGVAAPEGVTIQWATTTT